MELALRGARPITPGMRRYVRHDIAPAGSVRPNASEALGFDDEYHACLQQDGLAFPLLQGVQDLQ